MPIEPPSKRTEPEDCAMYQRKTLRKSISPCNVRDLVRDDGVELRIIPIAPGGGKQNRRPHYAHREWHRDEFGFERVWRRSKFGGSRAGPQPQSQANVLNLDGGPQQPPTECEAHEEPCEKQQSDSEIEARCDRGPSNRPRKQTEAYGSSYQRGCSTPRSAGVRPRKRQRWIGDVPRRGRWHR